MRRTIRSMAVALAILGGVGLSGHAEQSQPPTQQPAAQQPAAQQPAAQQPAAQQPAAQQPAAQQPPPDPAQQPPVFRTGINFVRVDVIVTDNKNGVPVGDLNQTDFEVAEDGKPQKI